jgi:hypothetical protein
MNFELKPLSNNRLICLTRFWGENLAIALMEWKEWLLHIPGVKVLDSKVLLYFFRNVDDPEFKKTPFWLAKSVVGFVPENNAYKVMDLDAGECWESEEFEFENFEQLEFHVKEVFQQAFKNGLSLAETWALVFDEESLCQKARVRLFYEKS